MLKRFFLIFFFFLLFKLGGAQVNTNDSLVLVDIYNSMNGSNWINNSNWLSGPVSSWYGITVSNNRVSKIYFSGNKIIGTLPNTIGRLSALIELNIHDVDSVGPNSSHIGQLPDSIGNLTNLEILWIKYSNLTGSIPETIGNLTSIKKIIIEWNHLTGTIPITIGNLQNLQWLDLQNNNLSGNIPPQIGNLSSLQILTLIWNHFTGSIPTEIGNLTKLKTLFLSGNQLSGMLPPELGNIDSLSFLGISFNNIIKSFPPELCNCSNLTTISVSNNNMSGTIPDCLGNTLTQFYIDNNHFSGAIPTTFVKPGQVNIWCSNNDLTELPDFTSQCDQKYIDPRNNKFTFEDFEPDYNCLQSVYWPQDSVLTPIDTAIIPGTNITLNSVVGGSANTYQWKKNGAIISTNTTGLFTINNMAASDTGIYSCNITSALVPYLTLWRYPIHLKLDTNGVGIYKKELDEQFISVYPNPANETLNISKSDNSVTMVYLLNMQSDVLMNKLMHANIVSINLTKIPKGIYLLKVVSDKEIIIKRFIKE